ncbi:MAG: acetylxylan esterase [SAR202 cluster bacterium]|nr:acetylxylan esterase [SAR202 cluster bacterium]MQG39293.1 acetylxylan esterase [SAR202 cluster bacterium]|tara:strand:- start:15497 stop:16537 length:1041 start_codon:yes stop_codon:yes gene_type:complete
MFSEDINLEVLNYTNAKYQNLKPSLTFSAQTIPQAESWQKIMRSQLIELIGDLPKYRGELNSKVIKIEDFGTYTRETILFDSAENMKVFAFLLVPKFSGNVKMPVIMCVHGHGRGVNDVVGIQNGITYGNFNGIHKNYAVQAVNQGYVVLAIEQFGFGRRRTTDHLDSANESQSSCNLLSGTAFLLGETMIKWRVIDVMSAIDYLETRKEIDFDRIAVMGLSGGGTTSFFSSALDERIKLAIISGYFCTFKDSIFNINHCIDNYIPGILKYAEMYDIAGLIAPRGLFIESATNDPIFPIDATKYAIEKAEQIFTCFGAKNSFSYEIFEGEHEFYGKGAFEFAKSFL